MVSFYVKTCLVAFLLLIYAASAFSAQAKNGDLSDALTIEREIASDSAEIKLPDWKGLRSDSYLILSYQLAVVGVIYFLPQEISGWNKDDKEGSYRLSQYSENIQDTHWDHDQWYINYLGHPYFGATYFVVARNRGLDKTQSFWYATTMSVVFEYGIEAFFEVPSVQDLIVTPVAGVVVGEYFYQFNNKLKKEIRHKGYADWKDKFLLFVTDPIGTLNRKVRQWTGKNVDINVLPYIRTNKLYRSNSGENYQLTNPGQTELGFNFSFQWN